MSESASSNADSRPVIAVVGNPNTGKSTLFSRLSGVRQKVGNYPGVTVEKKVGRATLDGGLEVDLVDLPGSYSLAAHSPDEMIAVDVLLGRVAGTKRPDAVLVVIDASNLRRNLFLASQVMELGIPVVVALNMMDVAHRRGIHIDAPTLAERMGCRVVPLVSVTKDGRAHVKYLQAPVNPEAAFARADAEGEIPDTPALEPPDSGFGLLKTALVAAVRQPSAEPVYAWPELNAKARQLAEAFGAASKREISPIEVERALLDTGSYSEERLLERVGDAARADVAAQLTDARQQLGGGRPLAAVEAAQRYGWIAGQLANVETRGTPAPSWSDRFDGLLTHRFAGTLIFVALMAVVFQAVFAWATPLMDLIDGGFGALGDTVSANMDEGWLQSFIVDGLIGGVGSVLIFLPQILILFLFIAILEDSGYMARAAFLMDRLMRFAGLSGQSFVPMLSSFACAIPGIMAARTIPDRRDRLTTILVAPLMSCSARLPVYTILIGAFIPEQSFLGGWVGLRGLVMLAMYLTGMIAAVLAATLIKKFLLKGPTPAFLMEMPPYKLPMARAVAQRLWERGRIFVVRAGTIIFAVTVVVWALSYFPRPESVAAKFDAQRAAAEAEISDEAALEERLAGIDNAQDAAYVEQSVFGQLGHLIEPLFVPLGWDWRISAATIASFPAREVVVSVLGSTFSLGGDIPEDDEGMNRMHAALQQATWPDGRPLFTIPVALSLMVFFALCMQCGATLATIKREANSWGWAFFAWFYMTALAWLAAFAVYQIGTAIIG